MLNVFRMILNTHDFFTFFEVFRIKTFLYSELQLRDMHHKIRHKIPHRTVHMRSLSSVEQKWFYTKN